MKITVFGSGYVGLVTGTCLANVGHEVICVDNNEEKISLLQNGVVTIYEPGLSNLILENRDLGTLTFTMSAKKAIEHAEVIFIAVGTPSGEDGSADLQYVMQVAEEIGQYMQSYKVVVAKSTVPVGSSDKIRGVIDNQLSKRNSNITFDIASNPEFLKEGSAISDFQKPDRIVIGSDSENSKKILSELYAPFNRNHEKIIWMSLKSSELTKYAANAMLATKISFINEMANLAEALGADIESVRKGIGSDSRIGFQFIYPGCGYGGSCFPKDVRALKNTAESIGASSLLVSAVELINDKQKQLLFNKITNYFGGKLQGKTIAVWGLSFKPNTDDIRDAPSITFLESALSAGVHIQAFDPKAMAAAKHHFGPQTGLHLFDTKEEATKNADALVIITEWQHFKAPDFDQLKSNLRRPVIFDGRNLYDPETLEMKGFKYFPIGR